MACVPTSGFVAARSTSCHRLCALGRRSASSASTPLSRRVAVCASSSIPLSPSTAIEPVKNDKEIPEGGRFLSCTTRHVRLYVGHIDPVTWDLDQSRREQLSLMLDPDNEFLWSEDTEQKVYGYFMDLVDNYAGAPLTEYTLRLIGSDIEHFVRKMLLSGEIQYNLDCRVLNFSMGKPYYQGVDIEG